MTTDLTEMEARHALERKWRENGKTLKLQWKSLLDNKWHDIGENITPSFLQSVLWREKPAETSAEVVRPIWEAMEKTGDPAVRVKDGRRFGLFWSGTTAENWLRYNFTFGGDDYPSTKNKWSIRELPPIPAPKYRPYTFEDAPLRFRVRRKRDGRLAVCSSAPDGLSCWFGIYGPSEMLTFNSLLADFEQLDGAKCGVLEESK